MWVRTRLRRLGAKSVLSILHACQIGHVKYMKPGERHEIAVSTVHSVPKDPWYEESQPRGGLAVKFPAYNQSALDS